MRLIKVLLEAKKNSKQLGPSTTITPLQQRQETQIENEAPKVPHKEENSNTNNQQVETSYNHKQQLNATSK